MCWYCERAVEYLLNLYYKGIIDGDIRVRHAVVVLMYMRLDDVVVDGITIVKKDHILSAVLPPYSSIPTMFGVSMGTYTNIETVLRMSLENAAASPGVDLEDIRMQAAHTGRNDSVDRHTNYPIEDAYERTSINPRGL